MVILFEGQLCKVVDFRHHTPGNLRAMVQTKLRNIRTGSSFEHRFRSADTVERASLEQHDMEYLYSDGDLYHFMNTETYEQIGLNDEQLGDATGYLKDGMTLDRTSYQGETIGVELPVSVDLLVQTTEPGFAGDTAQGARKPATVETGIVVQVPLFVSEGDTIRVDTRTGEYQTRL